MKKIVTVISIILYFLTVPVSYAIERHVPVEYATVESAIGASSDGDVIILDPNTYSGAGFVNLSFNGLAITIRSTDPNDPSVVAATIINCDTLTKAFVFNHSEGPNSVLNGLTIQNGYGYDQTREGVYCYQSSPTIKNCQFLSYNPSQPIFCSGADKITIDNSLFQNCSASYFADCNEININNCVFTNNSGAIDCQYSGQLNITNSDFRFHSGRVIDTFETDVLITDCNISYNSENNYNDSGAIYINRAGYCRIDRCTIKQNHGQSALRIMNSGSVAIAIVDINNCDISGNTSSNSGTGIWFAGSKLNITNSRINSNTGSYSSSHCGGAGIYCYNNCLTINNSEICYNSANGIDSFGAGIATGGYFKISNCLIKGNKMSGSDSKGAAISIDGGDIQRAIVKNCNIISNKCNRGGAIYGEGAGVEFKNCIIAENLANDSGGGAYFQTTGVNFINCTIAYNFSSSGTSGLYMYDSNLLLINTILADKDCLYSNMNMINVYHCFGLGEPKLTADYHLRADSPCIDAGDPHFYNDPNNFDIDGENRIHNIVDIGADEFIDNDEDGLPNFWEERYFGDVNIADANVDSDGDGIKNLEEYQECATEPNIVPIVYYVNPTAGSDGYDGLCQTWRGKNYGPKRTVKAAIALCRDNHNDKIILLPATYGENLIDPLGKAITISSLNPNDPNIVKNTVFAASDTFKFTNFEKWSTIIDGLAFARLGGSAIYAEMSSPTIKNCVIAECGANKYVWCIGGRPRFINDEFRLNTECIYFDKSMPAIRNCKFDQNTKKSAILAERSILDIENSYFLRNFASLQTSSSRVSLRNSVIKASDLGEYGTLKFDNSSEIDVTNCTIFGNSSLITTRPVIYCRYSTLNMTNTILRSPNNTKIMDDNGGSVINVNYCNIEGGRLDGIGNIDEEPNLTPDGHLSASSPCIDAGAEVNCPQFDIDGEVRPAGDLPDIGADEFIDSDSDNLPDYFEAMCQTGLPNNDDDWDGYTNKEEYELYSSDPNTVYKTFYVAENGNIIYDGLSWDYPKRYISEAVDVASDGDKIIISAMNHNKPFCLNGKAIVLQSVNPNDPTTVNNTQIPYGVSFRYGEGRGSKICGMNVNKSLTSSGDVSNAVYCLATQPTIEKCIITRSGSIPNGAGIYCEGASPVIIDCNISNNRGSYGAALYGIKKSSPYLLRCKISKNTASTSGGAIYLTERSNAAIEQCELNNNTASSSGGAVCLTEGNVVIEQCELNNNTASSSGGAMYCKDANLAVMDSILSGNIANSGDRVAGIHYRGSEYNVIINGCTFTQNAGSGVYINGGSQNSNFVIENSIFSYHSLMPALKIYSEHNVPLDIKNCSFYGNMGGVLNLDLRYSERVGLKNCLFTGNYSMRNSDFYIRAYAGPIDIENCTIAYNKAGDTTNCSYIFTIDGSSQQGRNRLTNSIIYGNCQVRSDCTMQPFFMMSGMDISYCDWQNLNDLKQFFQYSDIQWTGGCIDSEPMFLNSGSWDTKGTSQPTDDVWTQGDYHLQSNGWVWFEDGLKDWTDLTSRCVDAGNPASPLADEPIYGDRDPLGIYGVNKRINMGFYGGTKEASIPPNNWALEADINNDGSVDIYDLDFWIDFYLVENLPQVPADVNHDGSVNLADYALLASEWMDITVWH